jgi:hypothetical protein
MGRIRRLLWSALIRGRTSSATELPTDELGRPSLDIFIAYAMDHWCVPPAGVPDGEPGDGTLRLSHEVSDIQMRALYQLWYLWAKEDGRTLNDRVWATHYASLILASSGIPQIVWDGTLPVATAFQVLQHDPWDGGLVAYGDHAYTLPGYRGSGALYMILEDCRKVAEEFDVDKVVMPIAAQFDWEKYKPFYEAQLPGWEIMSRILVNDRRK